MLIEKGTKLFTYPATRDLGFAPNPFHGVCTLATCKPKIRKNAKVGDWVMGLLGANGGSLAYHCFFLMKVSEKLSFQEYWKDPRFTYKKSVRNGSKIQVLGDNIYYRDSQGNWIQEDSHHSNPDGTIHQENLKRDTGNSEDVLISNDFIYFGKLAEQINIDKLGYTKPRDYNKFDLDTNEYARSIILKFYQKKNDWNTVVGDPCHFNLFDSRVDQISGKFA